MLEAAISYLATQQEELKEPTFGFEIEIAEYRRELQKENNLSFAVNIAGRLQRFSLLLNTNCNDAVSNIY